MKILKNLEKDIDDNIIENLYLNNLFLSETVPEGQEYEKAKREISKLEKDIIKNSNLETKEKFFEYQEKTNEKESIEAKEQFKLGFKTAVKLIIEGLK